MSQKVIIKHNKYGMELVLDKDISFEKLLSEVIEKFRMSGDFFKDTKQVISFKGRQLSDEEMLSIVDTIMQNSSIQIISIMDGSSELEKAMKERTDAYEEALAVKLPANSQPAYTGEVPAEYMGDIETFIPNFYKGNLRSGQVLECPSSVTLIGDVNPGAKIISEGNIVVLGALKGNAYAGVSGNDNCFIFALDMSPIQLQIGQYYAKSPDKEVVKKKFLRKVKADSEGYNARIAIVRDGNICIEQMSKGCLDNL